MMRDVVVYETQEFYAIPTVSIQINVIETKTKKGAKRGCRRK